MKKSNRTMVIASQKAYIDGMGESVLRLIAVEDEKSGSVEFIVSAIKGNIIRYLRRFPTLLRALRSYRRYVNLSDEIKMGYV